MSKTYLFTRRFGAKPWLPCQKKSGSPLLSFVLLLALCFMANLLQAQQWLDKKYSYDSILNLVYGTAINFNGGSDTLNLDIYLPICDDSTHTATRPLLLWIHGGAFLAGSKDEPGITNLCKQFARRGYVTASMNYRLGFIADDAAWNCNYPNYSCVFAADSSEWYRALYRGIQDGKGALRYLINRHSEYRIDTSNIFIAGESAGAFVALGIALLDTAAERLPPTFALAAAPKPNANTSNCVYNQNLSFPNSTIPRPDLGDIEGNIEPTAINYTIKGVGNMYGAMVNDLLKLHKANRPKPAIYSFHQPCDLVVPIDSGLVYWGLSWCFTNGYNCYGIANTPKVYGSRTFSNWNTANNYGYTIQNEFTATTFPYNFLFGPGSCADQVNTPCHAYDSPVLRENNLASFFSGLITTNPVCDTSIVTSKVAETDLEPGVRIFPNPTSGFIKIEVQHAEACDLLISDALGRAIFQKHLTGAQLHEVDLSTYADGLYFVLVTGPGGQLTTKRLLKN